jgi:hypothetical protein
VKIGTGESSSVQVVEDFYGEPLTRKLLSLIRKTPFDQLVELASRLVTYNRAMERSLTLRHRTEGERASVNIPSISINDYSYLRGGTSVRVSEVSELKYQVLYSDAVLLPDLSL